MRYAIGCVAEPTPKYLDQAERLLKSWRWFAGRYAHADFHVCIVGDVPASVRSRYTRLGAQVHTVARVSERHPPSNKLRFLELDAARDADRAVLLDCDTIVVQEPHALFHGEALAAKIADFPTVPAPVFERVFQSFGLAMPERNLRCTFSEEPSIAYFNAGVLSFSRDGMCDLVPRWLDLNARLIEKIDLLGPCGNFCEQASLSLAVAATRTRFTLLPEALNFPAHFMEQPVASPFGQTDPVLIHYHWLTDHDGHLLPSPYPNVNRRIESFTQRDIDEATA